MEICAIRTKKKSFLTISQIFCSKCAMCNFCMLGIINKIIENGEKKQQLITV